jgi:hypothetical protein
MNQWLREMTEVVGSLQYTRVELGSLLRESALFLEPTHLPERKGSTFARKDAISKYARNSQRTVHGDPPSYP